MKKGLAVLLLGSGGREHALAWKLAQSPLLAKLYAAPGSDGMAGLCERVELDMNDPAAVTSFCVEKNIGLLFIGPEAPLAAGVADAVRASGVPVFGPSQRAAQLESSKAFSKDFMKRHGVPTAEYGAYTDPAAAKAAARAMGAVVVKADGLAAGKGVVVCSSYEDAERAIDEFMSKKTLGSAGDKVVLERRLEGPELSVLAFCDGKGFRLLPFSRDHKRLQDDDRGPNTGGMGAYAPVEVDGAAYDAIQRLLDLVLAGLQGDGLDYRGLLYTGLMLTKDGPQALEFNCRFGDPETQALIPLLDSDLVAVALSCADGALEKAPLRVRPGACLCVTMASEGYPARPVVGRPIEGLDAPLPEGVQVFHAGTRRESGRWLTAGGRVLSVCAVGADLAQARERAYAAAASIRFPGAHYRRDIAAAGVPR